MKRLSRSTVFAAFFTLTSFILALKGLLTGQYVAMATALQGWVVGRAMADDYHIRNSKEKDDRLSGIAEKVQGEEQRKA